jgi:hypothetical protein
MIITTLLLPLGHIPFKMRADMCIPGGLLFMWGVLLSFPFTTSVAASQKTQFQHSKNRKHTFLGMK